VTVTEFEEWLTEARRLATLSGQAIGNYTVRVCEWGDYGNSTLHSAKVDHGTNEVRLNPDGNDGP